MEKNIATDEAAEGVAVDKIQQDFLAAAAFFEGNAAREVWRLFEKSKGEK